MDHERRPCLDIDKLTTLAMAAEFTVRVDTITRRIVFRRQWRDRLWWEFRFTWCAAEDSESLPDVVSAVAWAWEEDQETL